ncbi:MAG TPA: DnaA/Hda family protein [Thermoplasmata archaeon]|nr:DnaA/Hda family protein [Thermoplasmata archaeon]
MIRKVPGSADALKMLLVDLRKYSFSGYVRTLRVLNGETSEGFVFLRAGDPVISVYYRNNAEEVGRAALKLVWQDSYDAQCTIELHARIDLDEAAEDLHRGVLERVKRPSRKGRGGERATREILEAKLARLAQLGYKTNELEAALKRGPEAARAAVEAFEMDVRRAEMLRRSLHGLDTKGFEERMASIEVKLKDPETLTEAEAEIDDLRREIERRKKGERGHTGVVDAPREPAWEIFEDVGEQPSAGPRSGGAFAESFVITATQEEPAIHPEGTNLIRQFSFDAFVVGGSNRFAHAACLAVAKSRHTSYNPLFITSGPGLGKTHLLNAIGNEVVTANPRAKVRYRSVEAFTNEMRDAQTSGRVAGFRDTYRGLDVLLLDDVQFLSGRGDVQEELFHTFNELYNAGKRIVLASDRLPKEIPDLEDRLVSRFEGGLVADVQPPDYDTRIAILRRKTRDARVDIAGDILPFIAQLVSDNIRELGGALNRVLAFSTLMGEPLTIELAREVLRPLEVGESGSGRPKIDAIELQPGTAYIVKEDRPSRSFRLFTRLSSGGNGGFVITRVNPQRLQERYELASARVLWLTDRTTAAAETIPPVLERIAYEIEGFMKKGKRGAILIDGIEYLVSHNSFEPVLKFVRNLVDQVSESGHTLLLSLSHGTLSEQEARVLEREVEALTL